MDLRVKTPLIVVRIEASAQVEGFEYVQQKIVHKYQGPWLIDQVVVVVVVVVVSYI